MIDVDCVVWDFDGVVNRNIVDGRFIWSDNLEADLGIPLQLFTNYIFSSKFTDVICGRKDLLEHIGEWIAHSGFGGSAQIILDYWLENDALPDKNVIEIMDQLSATGCRQVIATNNEPRRAHYIGYEMKFGQRVEAIFCSGLLGCAKPDPTFFDAVRKTLGLAADRLVLIDDSATNVAAAEAIGWKGFHFRDYDYASLKKRLGLVSELDMNNGDTIPNSWA